MRLDYACRVTVGHVTRHAQPYNKHLCLSLSLERVALATRGAFRRDGGNCSRGGLEVDDRQFPATICGASNSKYPDSFHMTTGALMASMCESSHLRVATGNPSLILVVYLTYARCRSIMTRMHSSRAETPSVNRSPTSRFTVESQGLEKWILRSDAREQADVHPDQH